jgi:hypothetical protein
MSATRGIALTFLASAVIGAGFALFGLGSVRLVRPVVIPAIIEEAGDGRLIEHFVVRSDDLIAASADPNAASPRIPPGIVLLEDPALAGAEAQTMKLRNSEGQVIGIASRLVAAEGAARAAWWTFVLGPRGTLAAQVADIEQPAQGRVLGGTVEFVAATGGFSEHASPAAGVVYELEVEQGG